MQSSFGTVGRPALRPYAVPSAGQSYQWVSRPANPRSWQVANPIIPTVLHMERVHSEASSAGTEGGPRRPLPSCWEDRTSEGRSTNSDILKPSHTTLEIAQFDDGDGKGGDGEHELEGAAHQLARAMGAEQLYVAFHTLHPDGHAPLAALPEVFELAGLPTSLEEVEVAVTKVHQKINSMDCIPYPQCQEVFLNLQIERQRSETLIQERAKAAGCLAHWMATDKDATNLLLIIVVTLCGLSAFLAAGVAILLLFLDGLSTAHTHLQEDLGMLQDTLDVFARQISVQTDNEEASSFSATLSTVLKYIGHIAAVETARSDLLKMATAVSNTISSWLLVGPEKSFVHLASLAALMANTSLSTHGLDETARLFDEVNAGLPSNYEVMLAQWQNSSASAVEYLTQFRYAKQCPNGTCITNASVTAPMAEALSGDAFAQYIMDYLGTVAYAGFTTQGGLGVEVKRTQLSMQNASFQLIIRIFQGWTSDSNSYEFLLAVTTAVPGQGNLRAVPSDCDAACKSLLVTPGWPMYNALMGQTGVMQFTNHRGALSLAAYTRVEGVPLALVVQMEISDIVASTNKAITSVLNSLNTQYSQSSQEFELSTFQVQDGNTTITHLTPYRFPGRCPSGQCLETPYVREAISNCSTGVMRTTDYRNESVLVGYSCISELNAVVSYKIDNDDNEADNLQVILQAVDGRTAQDTGTSAKFLLATPKGKLTASEVKGYGDFLVKSKIKYPDACVHPNCTWNSESALHALQGDTDVIDTTDYRNVAVKAATSQSTAISYGIGLALETDTTEVLQPMVDTAIKVGCFAIGMVAGSTLLLILITKLFLRSMITAKEEGKKAVEKEKERFSKLVASMYPAYVVPQLLAGEKQMVCEVPGAAVFFSDIHEFTSASNAVGSTELLQIMGYVYGVMDCIADRFSVYKVKTIGDAYLAVLGLPGTTSANVSLDLLHFASCVCQVFGDRFSHPAEGQVLALMNKTMTWNGRPAPKHASLGSATNSVGDQKVGSRSQSIVAPSWQSGGRLGSNASGSVTEASRRGTDRVQCIMSYGLAVGKLVAGVLAGRSPMFDIWGVTVNLASRMQSTGEPGRIQVSEHLYQKVIAVPGQPFAFEAPHTVFCKGFGNVNAYMVRTTAEGLPKDLQAELRLEPRYGVFRFDNLLSTVVPAGTQGGHA